MKVSAIRIRDRSVTPIEQDGRPVDGGWSIYPYIIEPDQASGHSFPASSRSLYFFTFSAGSQRTLTNEIDVFRYLVVGNISPGKNPGRPPEINHTLP